MTKIITHNIEQYLKERARVAGYAMCNGENCRVVGVGIIDQEYGRCVFHHARTGFTVEEHDALRAFGGNFCRVDGVLYDSWGVTQYAPMSPNSYAPEVWHVAGTAPASTAGRHELSEGYCYLFAIKRGKREEVMSLLGESPTFYQLLSLRTSFAETGLRMSQITIRCVKHGVTPLLDAFVTVAKAAQFDWPDKSIGGALKAGKRVPSGESPVLGGHRLGAVADTATAHFYDPGEPEFAIYPKYEPPMTAAVADDVLSSAMAEWGISASDTDAVVDAMLPLLCFGTSAKIDFSAVQFVCAEKVYTLEPLRRAACAADSKWSPVRRWVKSYKSGQLCYRMMEYLRDNPTSMVAQLNATRYDAYGRQSQLAFDCSHVLKHLRIPGPLWRRALRVVKAFKFAPG